VTASVTHCCAIVRPRVVYATPPPPPPTAYDPYDDAYRRGYDAGRRDAYDGGRYDDDRQY